jgi:polar amino acid transport system substrate-binding protein
MTMRLILLLVSSLSTLSTAGERIVLDADDEYPPYSYMENGQFKGLYVELIKRAAALLAPQYELELNPVPWKRGLHNLETGQSLGLVGAYRHKARTFISPYSIPFNREVVALFCTEQVMNKSPRNFPADFAGLTIGVNLGFALGERMSSATKDQTFTVRESKGNEANLIKLQAGEIDCYANDRLAVYHSLNQLRHKQQQNNFKQFSGFRLNQAQEISTEDAMIGYSASHASSSKDDFIEQMNKALAQLQKDGVIDALVAKSIEPGQPARAN